MICLLFYPLRTTPTRLPALRQPAVITEPSRGLPDIGLRYQAPERRLADVYQRPRRVIEAIVRERAQARLWPGPAQEKKAA